MQRADVALIIERGADNRRKVSPVALLALWVAIQDEADEALRKGQKVFTAATGFLARKVGLSKRTAANGLPVLREMGLIRQRTTWNETTGQFSDSEWEVLTGEVSPSATIALGQAQPIKEKVAQKCDPKGNPGGGGSLNGSEAGTRPIVPEAKGRFAIPTFRPIPTGVFQRELETMLDATRAEMKRLRADDRAWIWREFDDADAVDGVNWTERELSVCGDPARRAKLEADLKLFKARPKKREKLKLLPEAQVAVDAYTTRIAELEREIAGVVATGEAG